MTYASMAAQRNSYSRNQNTVSFSESKAKLGPISNFVVLLVMACLLAVLYLSQVIKTNNYSYSLNTLNEEKSSLEQEFASLQVESARLQSIETIKSSTAATELTTPAEVSYIN